MQFNPPTLDLAVEQSDPGSLRQHPRNARTHSDKQIAQISASIEQFGFTNPILIDETRTVIAGHGRLMAALKLGLASVPTIALSHLTGTQKRALMLADNKIAMNAGWDIGLLKDELLGFLGGDLDFDVGITGFDTPEIDLIIEGPEGHAADKLDVVDAIDRSKPARTRPGDLWRLGPHRLLCGNALDKCSYATLMRAERADQVVTDPPYNVPIEGHVGGLGKVHHREFAMASGEMSSLEFTQFLMTALGLMAKSSVDGAIIMAFIDWRHLLELFTAGSRAGLDLKNLCVWDKTNAGMGSLYRSQHELIAIFKSGKAPHVNNIELGKHGRYRTNVWRYAGANAFGRKRQSDLETHPTVKPIAMIMDAIKDCSPRGGIILDPFGGSGTTLVAAERAGRVARVMEIDPYYCDAAIKRWEKLTGSTAVLESNSAAINLAEVANG